MDFAEGHEGFVGVGLFGLYVGDGDLVILDDEFFAGLENDLFAGVVL
jgi:hypothetical protein